MPITTANGVRLYWELHGDHGAPVVLVHGSWGDHHTWDGVAPEFGRTFRVLTYDRRGHSQSERPATQGNVDEDAADLAALVETQHLAPAHIVGSSFGASIALRLAVSRPDLVASLALHEPPLFGLLGNDPGLLDVQKRVEAVMELLQSGQTELGAERFVETVALGPGMWGRFPPDLKRVFVFNASTWLDEMHDPDAFILDLGRLATFRQPVLLTQGDQSPLSFSPILEHVAATIPHAYRHTFRGAGHVPQMTHPADFVEVVGAFLRT